MLFEAGLPREAKQGGEEYVLGSVYDRLQQLPVYHPEFGDFLVSLETVHLTTYTILCYSFYVA